MNKTFFVTMKLDKDSNSGSGWPVAVYPTQEAAKKAVADSKAAKAELDRLYKERLTPYAAAVLSSCSVKKDGYTHLAKDGYYYATEEMAVAVNKREEFYASEDIKNLQKLVTGEDFYEEVKFVE